MDDAKVSPPGDRVGEITAAPAASRITAIVVYTESACVTFDPYLRLQFSHFFCNPLPHTLPDMFPARTEKEVYNLSI